MRKILSWGGFQYGHGNRSQATGVRLDAQHDLRSFCPRHRLAQCRKDVLDTARHRRDHPALDGMPLALPAVSLHPSGIVQQQWRLTRALAAAPESVFDAHPHHDGACQRRAPSLCLAARPHSPVHRRGRPAFVQLLPRQRAVARQHAIGDGDTGHVHADRRRELRLGHRARSVRLLTLGLCVLRCRLSLVDEPGSHLPLPPALE